MKKILFVICALVISGLFPQEVFAKETASDTDAQIVQTFCQSSDLYAYVNIPKKKENNSLIASALLDNNYAYKQSEPITLVSKSKEKVSYLFLVDISTSMPGFDENIKTFVSDFMSETDGDTSFALASFGNKFKLECDLEKSHENILTKLDTLQYNVRQTSLYSSIISAVDYFNKKKRLAGELYNIIVISDGINVDKNGVSLDKVEKKLKSSSIMLHTFGFQTKSTNETEKKASAKALKDLEAFASDTLGVHNVLGLDNTTEEKAGKEITGYVNNLYLTKFNISNFIMEPGNYPLKLTFATTGKNGTFFDANGTLVISNKKDTAIPAVSGTPGTGGSDKSAISKASVDSSKNKFMNGLFCKKLFCINIWMIVLFIILLLFIILFVLKVLFKKQKTQAIESKNKGIFIKIEILSDNCKLKKKELYINDELIIGRDKNCDIYLKNNDVSKRNSKLYVRDNIIYIEDLNSTNGTSIHNMKIYSPNKLRSGDIISIGSVEFSLKF